MNKDFTKEFFQKVWGEGYYEHFSYGVGIDRVYKTVFEDLPRSKRILEIGSGGGVFTELLVIDFDSVTSVDVIPMPEIFKSFNLTYIELPDQSNDLHGVKDGSMDFVFAYNVFCHMSNEFLKGYLKSVHRVLDKGGEFVSMLSDFKHSKKHIEDAGNYVLGDLLPMGHFYQDERTLDLIMGQGWEIVSRNMIPEHRDIIVHLKKI